MKEREFIGVVLGGDMNSYAVARAFYEEYRIKSVVIGKSPLYPTSYSRIIEGCYYSDLLNDDVLLFALSELEGRY
ncbi:MAG: ATP-grasp domain-containing protein, partial [Clostridiales bacterium]|nr:ATP-grasp domain-containing protein [Clostridiales bacterium]